MHFAKFQREKLIFQIDIFYRWRPYEEKEVIISIPDTFVSDAVSTAIVYTNSTIQS